MQGTDHGGIGANSLPGHGFVVPFGTSLAQLAGMMLPAEMTEDEGTATVHAPSRNVLDVAGLTLEIPTRRGVLRPVRDVSLSLAPGEVLGVVGESGAGKSMLGNAIVGLLEAPIRRASGAIHLDGERIDTLDPVAMRKIRGRRIGAIYQDPLTALDPLYSIGTQLVETILCHLPMDRAQARLRAVALLDRVGIPSAKARFDSLPHELSGGMRQRVVIALAIAADPRLIIADEPTTALDVTIQAQIVALLKSLCRGSGTAILLITHDMGVIAEAADRVAVMYAGRVVEQGPVGRVVQRPTHPYTAGLMAAIPELGVRRGALVQIDGAMPQPGKVPQGCAFHPRCAFVMPSCRTAEPTLAEIGEGAFAACWRPITESTRAKIAASPTLEEAPPAFGTLIAVRGLVKHFTKPASWLMKSFAGAQDRTVRAVQDVAFDIPRGRTFALVGESGSGKSTVAKLCVGLLRPTGGTIEYRGRDLSRVERGGRLQMVFQDPSSSLDPRWRVGEAVAEPLRARGPVLASDAHRRVHELLERVGLSSADAERYPHEFSGGQRQRISIARALICEPEFLVCDEPTSALDVSVQAQILNLLRDLQRERQLTYLFISHNLAVVSQVAHEVGVMYLGRLVETGPPERIFTKPRHDYTRKLLASVPRLDAADRRPR
jgi:oligopeptide/dipeptide ABC transporter ATP-binding protein